MMIKIQPGLSASRRTKTRIKQHGPKFWFSEIGFPICGEGKECILIRSVETDWMGWLPTDEIIWSKSDAN